LSIISRSFVDSQGKKHIRYGVNVHNRYTDKTQWVGTFTLKKDAEAAFDEAKRRIRLGELPQERKDIGFCDLVDLHSETLTVRRTSIDDYKYTANILRRYLRNRPVSQITREVVERFVSWCKKRGYSDAYTRKLKARLSQLLNVAVDWGFLSSNPAAGRIRNLPKEPRSKIKPLEAEEVRRLIDAVPPYHRALFLVLVSAGLRRSEAFGLTWGDVDLETGELSVTGQLQGSQRVEPKSEAARRTIPLPAVTLEALRARKMECPPTRLNLVFTTERGASLNPSNFYKRVWTPTKEAAGLPADTTLHQLRKTFASACASQGRTPAWLAEVMGHEKAATTLTFYTGVMKTEREEAKTGMNDWLARETAEAVPSSRVRRVKRVSASASCSTAVARRGTAA
jgi:integrase